MEYPITFYRQGWSDLSDWVLVMDSDHEKECRAKGFKHMTEFTDPFPVAEKPTDVAEIQQTAHNDATPKRRGRPPKVKQNDDSGATD